MNSHIYIKVIGFVVSRIVSYYLLVPFFMLVGLVIIINFIHLQDTGYYTGEGLINIINKAEVFLGKDIIDTEKSYEYKGMGVVNIFALYILFFSVLFDSIMWFLRKITGLKLIFDKFRLTQYIIWICVIALIGGSLYISVFKDPNNRDIGTAIAFPIIILIWGWITHHTSKLSFQIRSTSNK